MPAEDVARLGKDVRGRSQVTGHDKKAVKLMMIFRVCVQTNDVYDRTEIGREIFQTAFRRDIGRWKEVDRRQ
jgi:hypothetical protein